MNKLQQKQEEVGMILIHNDSYNKIHVVKKTATFSIYVSTPPAWCIHAWKQAFNNFCVL